MTGARFRKEDIDAIREAYENPEHLLEKQMIDELDNLEDEFTKDHVRALGWMVANKRLRIKIATVLGEDDYPLDVKNVEQQGIFHQKVGILEDIDGNQLSFSGSDNESAHGWQNNVEEFKVFRSWEEAEKEYFSADMLKFNRFWEGEAKRTKVIDMPQAIEEKLIEIAPSNIEELDLEKWIQKKKHEKTFELREYQKEAVEKWLKNDRRGILEMATGTGKTATAATCLDRVFQAESKVVAVISSPFIHLSEQWIKEIDKLGINCDRLLADSSQNRWKDHLVDSLLDVENGVSERLLILTTHNTFSANDFLDIIRGSKKRSKGPKFALIVDEVSR